jgi:hypothetical protein
METARQWRMASLRPGPGAGRRVWLTELFDPASYRVSGSGVDRVPGLDLVLVKSARGRRRRGGRPPAALELWNELPSGLGYWSRVLRLESRVLV